MIDNLSMILVEKSKERGSCPGICIIGAVAEPATAPRACVRVSRKSGKGSTAIANTWDKDNDYVYVE